MRVTIQRILCTVDFSDFSRNTVQYGMALAQEFDAELFLSHIIEIPASGFYGDIHIDPVEQQNSIMEYAVGKFREWVGTSPVYWEPVITSGHTADEIARQASQLEIDLVIAATHGRSGLKRLLIGSVTERMMRTLPCPLLVLRSPEKDAAHVAAQTFRLQRILVGCDFSSDSQLALQHGLRLAQEFQSELYLAHVIEPPTYDDFEESASDLATQSYPELRRRLTRHLQELIPTDAGNWCRPHMVLLDGQSHDELNHYAELHEMDLIVLGVRGKSLVENLFLGSTTDRVIRKAPCPVLAVRPRVRGF